MKSLTKEDIIKQFKEGKGFGAKIGRRELEWVKKLWREE